VEHRSLPALLNLSGCNTGSNPVGSAINSSTYILHALRDAMESKFRPSLKQIVGAATAGARRRSGRRVFANALVSAEVRYNPVLTSEQRTAMSAELALFIDSNTSGKLILNISKVTFGCDGSNGVAGNCLWSMNDVLNSFASAEGVSLCCRS
jgi:hypothetical protein